VSPRGRLWGTATLKALAVSGLLGVSVLSATQATGSPDVPAVAPAWVVYFLVGVATMLFIIKEGRLLLGHPPKRAHEEDLMKQLRELVAELATFRTETATQITSLEEGRARAWEEIGRLRGISEHVDERIGTATARVAHQTSEDVREALADLRSRLGILEQAWRRR